MRLLLVLVMVTLAAGCSTHKSGIARHDRFDNVRVEQMVGNTVTDAILTKTVVCLNARRESRQLTATTNQTVTLITNTSVTVATNLTISISTNYLVSAMTNQAPLLPSTPAEDNDRPGLASPADTGNASSLVAVDAQPSVTTNTTVSWARNQSAIRSPSQSGSNLQLIRTLNQQYHAISHNLSISLITNQVVTIETNQVLYYHTNVAIVALTNTIVAPTNSVCHDYFLYTELLTPPDFTLQGGESLVILVDGVRYGFSPTPSNTIFVGRKGFTITLYRAKAEALVAIANGREVRLRIKGVNTAIERTMNHASKQHFREFLLKFFNAPEPNKMVAAQTATSLAESIAAGRIGLEIRRPLLGQLPMASLPFADLP
jgi:hypothetical protein